VGDSAKRDGTPTSYEPRHWIRERLLGGPVAPPRSRKRVGCTGATAPGCIFLGAGRGKVVGCFQIREKSNRSRRGRTLCDLLTSSWSRFLSSAGVPLGPLCKTSRALRCYRSIRPMRRPVESWAGTAAD